MINKTAYFAFKTFKINIPKCKATSKYLLRNAGQQVACYLASGYILHFRIQWPFVLSVQCLVVSLQWGVVQLLVNTQE